MEYEKIKTTDIKGIISQNYEDLEAEKEEKIVNLLIEIIVSKTLKEYYEKSDQISKI